jgi:hypothetical protein
MAHHKRKGPKSTRAGCLMCKAHKDQRRKKVPRPGIQRKLQDRVAGLVDGSDALARIARAGC